jgi:hypothetical protein
MKKTIVVFALLSICGLLLQAVIPDSERQALIDLYNSTNGANWLNHSNWLGASGTENTWYGVTTDSANTTVVIINLQANNLVGTLPAGLGNLGNLQALWLQYNQLSGTIPKEIGNLLNLSDLGLHYNLLSGTIPIELGNMTNLQSLWLDANRLTGAIPSELGNLINLTSLNLDFNHFLDNQYMGTTIPKELGKLTNLLSLHLHWCSLGGTIPSELGNLTKVYDLYLSGNGLHGEIPASLAKLPLDPDAVSLGYNALHTSDQSLLQYLNQNDADWAMTQTIAPANLKATALSWNKVLLSWDAISYKQDLGGFFYFYSTSPIGPWSLYNPVSLDKELTSDTLDGLAANTLYYFKVHTFTDYSRQNGYPVGLVLLRVESDDSEIVSVTTPPAPRTLWKAGTKYKIGDGVIYKDQNWQCTYAHTAQANWYPGAAGIWFWTLADYDGLWHSGIPYKKGDVVQYLGKYWQCTYAHTAQANWYPGAPGIWFWRKI